MHQCLKKNKNNKTFAKIIILIIVIAMLAPILMNLLAMVTNLKPQASAEVFTLIVILSLHLDWLL